MTRALTLFRIPVQVRVLLAGIVASVVLGLLVSMFPREALLSIGVAAAGGVLLYFRSFLLSSIFFCGTVALLRDVGFGPVSGMGMLTIYMAVASWCLLITYRNYSRTVLLTMTPFLLFTVWGFVTLLWSPERFTGFQNLLVIAAFAGFVLIGAEQSRRDVAFQDKLLKMVIHATWLAGAVYLAMRFAYGSAIETGVGSRGFALLALSGTACALARWRYKPGERGFFHATSILALIGYSLSRTATVVGILLYPISRWNPRSAGGWVRLGAWAGIAVGALVVLVTQVESIRSRFVEGDMAMEVAGIPINAMGRTRFWEATLRSHAEAPWMGNGAGTAEQLIARIFGISHPHNDYLRILHDFGRIGMALWVIAMLILLVVSLRSWIIADANYRQDAGTHLAAFLGLIAVTLTMVTDNVIVYIFVMAPLGAIIGASLGRASTYERTPEFSHGADPVPEKML